MEEEEEVEKKSTSPKRKRKEKKRQRRKIEEREKEEEEEEEEEDSPIPIDRGWAWMVVVGCFGMHVLVVGGVKSFGVLFVEFQQLYDVSAKQLGVVHGVASVLMMALGPVSNALSVRFSCRAVVLTGGVLIGCGFLSSAFVPSFTWLYFTYSVLTGLGSALAYAPSVIMVGHHFTKRRALANGISVSGSAVGSFVLPNLMRYLLNHYGLRGALAIIGAIMFHVCACAALFRPLTSYRHQRTKPASKTSIENASTSIPQCQSVSSFQAKDDEFDHQSLTGDSCKLLPREYDQSIEESCKVLPTEDNLHEDDIQIDGTSTSVPSQESCGDVSDSFDDSKSLNLLLSKDKEPSSTHSPSSPTAPTTDTKDSTAPDRSPDFRRVANINSPGIGRKLGHSNCDSQNEKELGIINSEQDNERNLQTSPSLQTKMRPDRSPDLRRPISPGSPTLRTLDSDMRQPVSPGSPNLRTTEHDFRRPISPGSPTLMTIESDLRRPISPGSPTLRTLESDLRRPKSPVSPTLRTIEPDARNMTFEKVQYGSPIWERLDNSPRSPKSGRLSDPKKSPNLARVDELRRSEYGGMSDVLSHSDSKITCPKQGHKNGPASTNSSGVADSHSDIITANTILNSLEKKLCRNASVNSMITHFGSIKHSSSNPDRTGSFKLNFRRDSSKSKNSGSLKRRAFKGGKPILERHPSALWDTRLPDSLKQAIEEEKQRPQRENSIEMAVLHKGSHPDLVDSSLERSGSKSKTKDATKKRFGSFKAIDAAKPIRFIQERKKLLLATNLRYRSETRDAGVATPTLIANEKVPLKRFYSVEAGHQQSPMLHESYLHRRIRHISAEESWKSESSIFASAGDLALASLQNIAASGVEAAEEDAFSTTSRASGIKGILRLSAQTVHKGEKKKTSVPLFELSLLLNPVFLVFFVSLVCMNFGYPNIFVMLPSYCQQEAKLDKTTAAFMVSIIGLTDLVGRIFIGWFSDLRLFPRKYGFMVSLALAGILCTLLPNMKSYHGLIAFASAFGFCGGCFIALIAVILVDFLGKERLASSFGLASVAMAVGIMAGPAIYGDVRDKEGSWDMAFVVAGIMTIAAASCILLEPLAQHVLNRPIRSAEQEIRDEML